MEGVFQISPGSPIYRTQRELGVDVFEPSRNALSLFVRKDAGMLCSRLKSISVGANSSRAELASLDGFLRNRQATGFIVKHLETFSSCSDSVDEANEGFAPLVGTFCGASRGVGLTWFISVYIYQMHLRTQKE